MSTQLDPLIVNWSKFTKSFPKPGKWTSACKKCLDWDDFGVSIEFGKVYERLRKHLAPETAAALDKLVVAVCVNGVSRRKGIDHSALFVPEQPYNKDDFQYGDEGYVIPRASPSQVVEVLDAVESVPHKALAADIAKGWSKAKAERFESADEYLDHIANWVAILREARTKEGGLAIDLV